MIYVSYFRKSFCAHSPSLNAFPFFPSVSQVVRFLIFDCVICFYNGRSFLKNLVGNFFSNFNLLDWYVFKIYVTHSIKNTRKNKKYV